MLHLDIKPLGSIGCVGSRTRGGTEVDTMDVRAPTAL